MKRIFFLLFLLGCNTVGVTDFESCIDAGNPVMESHPRQCQHDGITYVEVLKNECPKKTGEFCIEVEMPVCGSDGETYGNSCKACRAGVEYWIDGTCE